jgi:hypothetical protein
VLIGLVACGSASVSGQPDPSDSPLPVVDVDGFVAMAPGLDGSTAVVRGFMLVSGADARLCALVLESFPPQCGGADIILAGTIPADVMAGLDSTNDPSLAQASWGDVTVNGTVSLGPDGTSPTLTIGSIELSQGE